MFFFSVVTISHKSKDNKALLIVYLGLNKTGVNYQRYMYGYMQMFSKVGGMAVALHKVFIIIVLVVCHHKFKSKLIGIINTK